MSIYKELMMHGLLTSKYTTVSRILKTNILIQIRSSELPIQVTIRSSETVTLMPFCLGECSGNSFSSVEKRRVLCSVLLYTFLLLL